MSNNKPLKKSLAKTVASDERVQQAGATVLVACVVAILKRKLFR